MFFTSLSKFHIFDKTKHVHFVGIGGVGLCSLAEIIYSYGFVVTGSDNQQNEATQRLSNLGLTIFYGHRAEYVDSADVLVVSPAIPDENVEVKRAVSRRIPIITGAEMLSEIMRYHYSIAIAGTHGKTTTTAMTASVLEKLDPTVVVGGKMIDIGSHARIGKSNIIVCEADEAYGSIKYFKPNLSVVTSIDADHLDYYRDLADISHTFLEFINRVPFYSSSVLCLDQNNIQKLLPKLRKPYMTYGFHPEANIRAENIQFESDYSSFIVYWHDTELGQIRLNMPGLHNVSNALAAISVALTISPSIGNISFTKIQHALASFGGIHRRFEILGLARDILVVDDYAHNPAKLRAVFNAAKTGYERRVVGIVQPHRYQRIHSLYSEFASAFFDTDLLFITPIYGTTEQTINGISSEDLAEDIRKQGHRNVMYIPNLEIEGVVGHLRPNDIVITAGAGDIWKFSHKLLVHLKNNND